ncbi:hypothetical protein SAMN05216344_102176 [Polaromonas sp. OV174]|uniref:hypothetical protein n=1 Tax=Polaromonas sp. OV174 TaxID=1855300 RepID=UPI0008DFB0DE|nr:hypothetical protein [Polaromonas sp. OV174]SFB74251.1 hypothetical protein SAMN05216344_102176 [Polaromonas sp. OV174]
MIIENTLKAVSKSPDELIVGNYMVLFGGRDLVGEFFTKSTAFESNYTDIGTLYVDFEHGLDPDGLGIDDSNVLGVVDWKSAKVDEKGIFVHRVLNRRAKYVDFLSELLDAGMLGNSSEAVRGKTLKKPNGEITAWPLKRDTLTLTPMEPRMITGNVLEAAKSLAALFPHSKALATLTGAPANESDKGLKTIEGLASLSEIERHLRDACGMSKSEALAMVSRVKSVISRSDSGDRDQLVDLSAVLKARAVF